MAGTAGPTFLRARLLYNHSRPLTACAALEQSPGGVAGVRLPQAAWNPKTTPSAACPQTSKHAHRWGQFVAATFSRFHAIRDKLTPATRPLSGPLFFGSHKRLAESCAHCCNISCRLEAKLVRTADPTWLIDGLRVFALNPLPRITLLVFSCWTSSSRLFSSFLPFSSCRISFPPRLFWPLFLLGVLRLLPA